MDSSAPLAPLSASNRGPLVIVATYILLTISLLAVSVKIWTRLSNARRLLGTDWVILAGSALAVAQAIALTISVNSGLGLEEDGPEGEQRVNMNKALYAANILTIIVLATAKISVALLLAAIRPPKPVLIACYTFIGIVVAWCTSGSLAAIFQCQPPALVFVGGRDGKACVARYALQVALGVVDIATDFAIVVLAYYTVRGVQIDFRRRASIVALFGLRLLTPVCTIGTLVAYGTYWHRRPRDTRHDIIMPVIWSQGALHTSVITACIPSIKRFFMNSQSGLMGVQITEQYEMTHASRKDMRSTTISQHDEGLSHPTNRHIPSNTERRPPHDNDQHVKSEVYTGKEDMDRRTRIRGGLPKKQADETESMKGLTSTAIHERREFTIEIADGESNRSYSK